MSVVSVQIEKKSSYGYLKEIVVRRADQKLYKFKKGDILDLHLNDIEDILLLIDQNKFFNLEGDVIVDFVTALKMFTRGIIIKNGVKDVQLEPYTPNFDPPRVIYEDKNKKKRLMCVDEINKFCDSTLQLVHNILHERLLNFKFGYNKGMPSREWTKKDKRRTGIMMNKIDDQLLKRRIIRSLELLVGGRKIDTDKQLLQRTLLPRMCKTLLNIDARMQGGNFGKENNKVVKVRKGVKVRMGIMQTKTELTLEQTQQVVSHEVLVSIEGVEE
ncbi:hypothetical protein Tco_0803430 [Tanacetum coccineum]|uniref:Uncharacterized protein n=1 Tax=Tanacetum coccineum TaxID=301880 RepID=A0ABQ5A5M9_9ASTR